MIFKTLNIRLLIFFFNFRLFEKYPKYKELFTKFQEEGKTLVDSKQFMDHAVKNVMLTICQLIDNLENDKERIQLLQGVGERHFKRNVRAPDFAVRF